MVTVSMVITTGAFLILVSDVILMPSFETCIDDIRMNGHMRDILLFTISVLICKSVIVPAPDSSDAVTCSLRKPIMNYKERDKIKI